MRSRVVRICVLRGAARPRGAAPALSARGCTVAATPRGAHRWRRVGAGGGASSSGAPRHRGLPAPGLTTLIRSGWQRRPWPPPRPAWCPRPALRVGVSVCSAQLGSAQRTGGVSVDIIVLVANSAGSGRGRLSIRACLGLLPPESRRAAAGPYLRRPWGATKQTTLW